MSKVLLPVMVALVFAAVPCLSSPFLPVENGTVTSGVGWRPDPFGSGRHVYHRGTDIAVPAGTPVRPTQSGYVTFAGDYGAYGKLVAVAHGEGYMTIYGHNSRVNASVGDWVDTSTVIAFSGSTGRSTGPHLHYEVRRHTGKDRELQDRVVERMRENLGIRKVAAAPQAPPGS